jgi:hypothetical protein
MGSLRGVYPVGQPYEGWVRTPVLEVPVGWWVEVHGARYEVTTTFHRVVPGGNGLVTLYGGPHGPDYIWDGAKVWMYTGEEITDAG